MSIYNLEFLRIGLKKIKYTIGIQKSMLTTVSCLLLCAFDSVFQKKKKQLKDDINMNKELEKLRHTHTLKVTKCQKYTFCDMVSLTDQSNIGRIKALPGCL